MCGRRSAECPSTVVPAIVAIAGIASNPASYRRSPPPLMCRCLSRKGVTAVGPQASDGHLQRQTACLEGCSYPAGVGGQASERACSWIQASWQRPQRGLHIGGCFPCESWASSDSPSPFFWLPQRWRSLSPRSIRTVQLRAWSRHELSVMSSSSRALIGARVAVIKRRGNLIWQIERFSGRWNQRARRQRVSYPTRETVRR